MLAAPGKLVAQGTPVALKSRLGQGYTIDVAFDSSVLNEKSIPQPSGELLDRLRRIAPHTYTSSASPNQVSYHLKEKDSTVVQRALQMVEDEREAYSIASYSVLGTSIEDIFLDLMHDDTQSEEGDKHEGSSTPTPSLPAATPSLHLTNGRKRSPLSQAFTIFHKRYLIARRSWLTPFLAVLIAVAGSCVPLFFLSNRPQTCVTTSRTVPSIPLYLPSSPLLLAGAFADPQPQVLASPPGIISTLGQTTALVPIDDIPDNTTFVNTVQQTFRNQTYGGISVNTDTGSALVAWEATPPGLTGLVMLNLASNVLYNNALNVSGRAGPNASLIAANYQNFPGISGGTLVALKWVAFFGAAMVCCVPHHQLVLLRLVYRLYFRHSFRYMCQRSDVPLFRPCNYRTVSPTLSVSGWAI